MFDVCLILKILKPQKKIFYQIWKYFFLRILKSYFRALLNDSNYYLTSAKPASWVKPAIEVTTDYNFKQRARKDASKKIIACILAAAGRVKIGHCSYCDIEIQFNIKIRT